MVQKQSKNTETTESTSTSLCDEESSKRSEKLENYKAFFRYLLSGDEDDKLADEVVD